jgi:hypothetical protein
MEHFLRQNKAIIGFRPSRCRRLHCHPTTLDGVLFLVVVYQRALDKPPFCSGSQSQCRLACILLYAWRSKGKHWP